MLYEIKNISKTRPGAKGYRLVIPSLRIPNGAKLAITGPSGCGKSTTLDILGLSLAPDLEGDFFLRHPGGATVDVMGLWKKADHARLTRLRLENLGYVLQTGELFPYLNVGENLLLVARLAGKNRQDSLERAKNIAQRLGIADLWNHMPATLSVGERQRVAIGRALVPKPPVILADEPTAALDPVHAEEVMEIFLDALHDFGSALVLVTHNVQWALGAGLTQVEFQLSQSDDFTTAVLEYAPESGEMS